MVATRDYTVADFERLATFVPTPTPLLSEVNVVTVSFRNKITTERAENFNSTVFRNYYLQNDNVYFILLTNGTSPTKNYDSSIMADTGEKLYFDNRQPTNEEEAADNGVTVYRMPDGTLVIGDLLSNDYGYILEVNPNGSYLIGGAACTPLEYMHYVCDDLYK